MLHLLSRNLLVALAALLAELPAAVPVVAALAVPAAALAVVAVAQLRLLPSRWLTSKQPSPP